LHIAQKFERLLDAHRRPDGSRWTGQQLDEVTGGVVGRSYVTKRLVCGVVAPTTNPRAGEVSAPEVAVDPTVQRRR